MTETLICGCIPGKLRCPEATRLWAQCIVEYEDVKANGSRESWERYVAAYLLFDEHLAENREGDA